MRTKTKLVFTKEQVQKMDREMAERRKQGDPLMFIIDQLLADHVGWQADDITGVLSVKHDGTWLPMEVTKITDDMGIVRAVEVAEDSKGNLQRNKVGLKIPCPKCSDEKIKRKRFPKMVGWALEPIPNMPNLARYVVQCQHCGAIHFIGTKGTQNNDEENQG